MEIIIAFIITYVIYIFIRRAKLQRQTDKFNKLLYVDKSPEKYIAEVDKLLRKLQSDTERNINLIQKTTGLLYAGRFEEVINILTVDIKKIPPNWQPIYYHNLVLSLYLNGEIEKGNEYLNEAKEPVKRYEKFDFYKSAIDMMYAVSDYYNGNGQSQKQFFEKLSSEGRNDYRIAFGYYFLGKINEIESNHEESELCFNKSKLYGKGSFLENLSVN